MPVSDADYLAWLKGRNRDAVVLAHLNYKVESGGVPVSAVRYLSDKPYIDYTVPRAYIDCIESVPTYRRDISGENFSAYSSSFGTLELINDDGQIDAIVSDFTSGSEISFYYGDTSWPISDFRLIFSARIEKAEAPTFAQLHVQLKDTGVLIDKSIGGDIKVGGLGPNADRFRPLGFGYVRQIECMVVDEANLRYVLSDTGMGTTGAFYVIQTVRERGAVTLYTDNLDGTIDLTNSPNGPVTADVIYYVAATDKVCISDAMDHLIGGRAGLTALSKYAGAGATFDVRPGSGIGAWIDAGGEDYAIGLLVFEKRNIQDLLAELCDTGLCFWAITRTGNFTFGRIRPHDIAGLGVASQASITEGDFKINTFKLTHAPPTYYRLSCVANRNWSEQTDLAGSLELTPFERGQLARKGLAVIQHPTAGTGYNANPQNYNLTLVQSPELQTLLSASTDITGELRARHWMNTRRAMFVPWVETISGTFEIEYYPLELGDPVTLTMPRFGYTSGAMLQVIGIDINLSAAEVSLRLCRRSTSSIGAGLGSELPPEEPVPLTDEPPFDNSIDLFCVFPKRRTIIDLLDVNCDAGSPPPEPEADFTIDVQTEDATQLRAGPWVRFEGSASGDQNVLVVGNIVTTPPTASIYEFSAGDWNYIENAPAAAGRVASYGGNKIVHVSPPDEDLEWWTISATGYDTQHNVQTLATLVVHVAASIGYTVVCDGTELVSLYDADGANLIDTLDTSVGATFDEIEAFSAAVFDNGTTGNTEIWIFGLENGADYSMSVWEVVSGIANHVEQWNGIFGAEAPPIGASQAEVVVSDDGLTLAFGGDVSVGVGGLSESAIMVITRGSLAAGFSNPTGGSEIITALESENGPHAGLGRAMKLSPDGSMLLVGLPLSDKGEGDGGYYGRAYLLDVTSIAGGVTINDGGYLPICEFTHTHDVGATLNSAYGVGVDMSGGQPPTRFAIATSDVVGSVGKVDVWHSIP